MTLMYRGVTYSQPAATGVSSPTTVTGKYRGAEMRISQPVKAPANPYRFNLKYRGVPYEATTNTFLPNTLATAF